MNRPSFPSQSAFTLIEVMVSTVIVVILAGILISATDLTAKSFQRTSAKIEQFSEARRGFEVLTRRIAEATLNTYFDYYNDLGEARPSLLTRRVNGVAEPNFRAFVDFKPATYGRQSELRFVSGPMNYINPSAVQDRPTHGVFFQAPVGEVEDREKHGMLDHTLNSWGYFLEVAEDREYIPSILKNLTAPRRRSRLLEFRQPTELNPIFFPPYAGDAAKQGIEARNWWFLTEINRTSEDRAVRVVAENVIALLIVPRLSRTDEISRANDRLLNISNPDDDRGVLCPDYFYDTALNTTRIPPNPPLTAADKPEDVNPKNQLPPTVQVVMVALDEASASRLDAATPNEKGFKLETENIFKRSVRLEDNRSTQVADDGEINELERRLISPKLIAPGLGEQPLSYRVFNTTVIIRGSKWSRAQAK